MIVYKMFQTCTFSQPYPAIKSQECNCNCKTKQIQGIGLAKTWISLDTIRSNNPLRHPATFTPVTFWASESRSHLVAALRRIERKEGRGDVINAKSGMTSTKNWKLHPVSLSIAPQIWRGAEWGFIQPAILVMGWYLILVLSFDSASPDKKREQDTGRIRLAMAKWTRGKRKLWNGNPVLAHSSIVFWGIYIRLRLQIYLSDEIFWRVKSTVGSAFIHSAESLHWGAGALCHVLRPPRSDASTLAHLNICGEISAHK